MWWGVSVSLSVHPLKSYCPHNSNAYKFSSKKKSAGNSTGIKKKIFLCRLTFNQEYMSTQNCTNSHNKITVIKLTENLVSSLKQATIISSVFRF